MPNLNIENIIFSYDNRNHLNFNKCIQEIKSIKNVKESHSKLVESIMILRHGPIYRLPCLMLRNINIYPLINIIRRFFY